MEAISLDDALTSYEVSFSLMHQPLKGPSGPPARPNKRGREEQPSKSRGRGRAPRAKVAARARRHGFPFPSSSGTRAVWPHCQAVKLCALISTSTGTNASASPTPALESMCAPSALETAPLRITGSD